MKKLLLTVFTFCIFNFTFAVQTNLLTFDTRDHGQIAQPNIRVTLSLLWPNPRTYEGQFIRQQPIAKLTEASGIGYFTNILWGIYRADIAGSPGTSYILYVGTNTLGTVNAASLVTNSAAVPPNDATLYYSKAQVDALIAGIETGSGTTGALTNNDTRAVTFVDQLTIGTAGGFSGDLILHDGASSSLNIDYGSGTLNVPAPIAATGFAGDGASLTALDGTEITTGTVADARIASTITRDAELTAANTVVSNGVVTGLGDGSFVFAGNGAGLTNLINITTEFGRSRKANEFPWTSGVVKSNLPLRVLLIGDSITANEESTQGLRYRFDRHMVRGGFGSVFANSFSVGQDPAILFAQSGGLAETTSDAHTKQSHFHLSNGQQYISSGIPILANKLTIYYAADAAHGTMLVETQALGGAYATLTTIDSALGTGNIATNLTLSGVGYIGFRITSTGNNVLLGVGLIDTTEQRSHAWAKAATPGDTVTNILYDSYFWLHYTNYNPQLVIVEAKDVWYDFAPALDWMRLNLTNADLVIIAPSPNSDDAGIPAQCELIFRYAATNHNISAFDKNSLFYPTNFWIPLTFADSAHLNLRGTERSSAAFSEWFGDTAFELGGKTNIQFFSVLDSRLISAGAMQTTVPELLNEVYYGGSTLWQHGFRMNSGAPRTIGLYLPSSLVVGKKNIAVSQRWLTTNAQNIAHNCVLHRLSFGDISRREKVGSTGGNVLSTLTGTNLVTYRVLNSFTQPIRDGDYVFCELGHGGTLTNSIFWMGAKVEAY